MLKFRLRLSDDQFSRAVDSTWIRNPAIVKAAHMAMVEGATHKVAASACGVRHATQVSTAVKRIREVHFAAAAAPGVQRGASDEGSAT